MSENSLKETVTRLATPLVQAQGLEIWGVEIAQAGRTTVRVFVDLPLEVKQAQAALSADNLEDSADIMTARSASIDQCEEISRQLGLALEVEDLIEQAYVLEVSTPGFSRLFFSLDQMRSYVGDMVELRMVSAYAPENAPAARRAWRGVLREVTDSAVRVAPASVSAEGDICPEAMDEVLVPWDMVRRASRIHIFRQPQKPGKQPARKAAKAAPQGDAPKKGKGKSKKKGSKSGNPMKREAEEKALRDKLAGKSSGSTGGSAFAKKPQNPALPAGLEQMMGNVDGGTELPPNLGGGLGGLFGR